MNRAQLEVLLHHGEFGQVSLLVVKEGRKYLHAVEIDKQVKMVALPRESRRQMRPLLYKGQPYPVSRAVRAFMHAGKTLGITKSATTMLRAVKGAQ